jgi:hypothetical protein
MSQLRVVPCLQGKAPRGKESRCECSLRERPGHWDGTLFLGWSRRARGHRHHQDAWQGRAAARGGRGGGGRRRAGSRGGDRGGGGRRAGGDRAPDAGAGGRAEPPQGRPGVRRHQRAADPGHRHLLAAAARAGTRRVIAQGDNLVSERSGGPVKTEEDPLASRPPSRVVSAVVAAIKHVDQTVPLTAPEGIVLRYGGFYGPGASEVLLDGARKRQFPVTGGGTGIWSFIEITDAAAAASLASTTSWTATRRRSRSGCRAWPRSRARSRRCACPLGSGGCSPGVRRGPDDRGARGLEREGQERARLGAAVRELAGGIRCLGRRMRRARPPTGRCCSPSPTG